MDKNGAGILGLLGIIICAAAAFFLRNLFPGLAKLIFWILGIAVALIAALVILVIVLAMRKPKTKKTENGRESPEEVLGRGRRSVLEIRRIGMRLKNPELRSLCGEICDSADRILRTAKEMPERLGEVRKCLNYYLPTLGSVLKRYVRIEESGVPAQEMTYSALACLRDISSAMERQHEKLFTNEMLDLSVEMELMTTMCRRDGLIDDEDFSLEAGENITLKL
ncbi:MAG: 5-bromo-4-chloroindolyl phosphate hydrolysis family protein [Oscillospiraceae bacterium]|nr:5-bromo-4-chloroindolyl phosphate hydrolysis family protein [Oscillospiraceae bacterium]